MRTTVTKLHRQEDPSQYTDGHADGQTDKTENGVADRQGAIFIEIEISFYIFFPRKYSIHGYFK